MFRLPTYRMVNRLMTTNCPVCKVGRYAFCLSTLDEPIHNWKAQCNARFRTAGIEKRLQDDGYGRYRLRFEWPIAQEVESTSVIAQSPTLRTSLPVQKPVGRVRVIPTRAYLKIRLRAISEGRDVVISEMFTKSWTFCPVQSHWVREVGVRADTGEKIGCRECIVGRGKS